MNEKIHFDSYDYIIVMFSGGKDSTAAFLRLLDLGVPKEKIELWHHLVDGRGGHLMDWECTEDYCRKFAAAFGVSIYYSWKDRGFEGEMLRTDEPTKPTFFETPDGLRCSGGAGKPNTRRRFPQVSADLKVRWCSPYLKIMVAATALRNQPRFNDRKVLVISGERAAESPNRERYAFFEPGTANNRQGASARHVDHCRIVHQWSETAVWDIIKRYKVVVHPAYYLGYGRCSCKWCIFSNADQMATSYYLSPKQGDQLCSYESSFDLTMRRDTKLMPHILRGKPYAAALNHPLIAAQAISLEYVLPIFTDDWTMPAGAFAKAGGPT